MEITVQQAKHLVLVVVIAANVVVASGFWWLRNQSMLARQPFVVASGGIMDHMVDTHAQASVRLYDNAFPAHAVGMSDVLGKRALGGSSLGQFVQSPIVAPSVSPLTHSPVN